MTVKEATLSMLLVTVAVIACDVGAQLPTAGGQSRSKGEWSSDTRPYQSSLTDTMDSLGVSARAEDGDAVLFVECTLDSVAIDWPKALLLGSGETIRTDEAFVSESDGRTSSYYDWYGSVISRKRVVRQTALIMIVPMRDRGKQLNTQEFVREFAENKWLEITQGGHEATFDLTGFEDAFKEHCS